MISESEYNALVTGIFDLHSHIGVYSLPLLRGKSLWSRYESRLLAHSGLHAGSNDGNSWKGLTLPWLRSLDGINVYDESIPLAIAGGVTSSLILLGSADAIGGQAIAIKLRPTLEGSPSSMVLEPPFRWNGTYESDPSHWRHIKHATGENPSQAYRGNSPTSDNRVLPYDAHGLSIFHKELAWIQCGHSDRHTRRPVDSRQLRTSTA